MIIRPFEIIIFYNEETLPFAEKLYNQIGQNFKSYTKSSERILTQDFLIRLKSLRESSRAYKPDIVVAPPEDYLTEMEKDLVKSFSFNGSQIFSYEGVFKEWEKLLSKNKQ